MNKITGISIITTGEGQRITCNYSTLDDAGNITGTNNRANYIALKPEVLAAVNTILTDAETHLG